MSSFWYSWKWAFYITAYFLLIFFAQTDWRVSQHYRAVCDYARASQSHNDLDFDQATLKYSWLFEICTVGLAPVLHFIVLPQNPNVHEIKVITDDLKFINRFCHWEECRYCQLQQVVKNQSSTIQAQFYHINKNYPNQPSPMRKSNYCLLLKS